MSDFKKRRLVVIAILMLLASAAYGSPIGAVDKIEGEWLIEHGDQLSENINPDSLMMRWFPIRSDTVFTLQSQNGCIRYWLLINEEGKFHSACPTKGEKLVFNNIASTNSDLKSIELSLSTQRDDRSQFLNVNTHLPQRTVVASNSISLSWAGGGGGGKNLKEIFLDGELQQLEVSGQTAVLPLNGGNNWQEWKLILSDGKTYSGKVQVLSKVKISEINEQIARLKVKDSKDRSLSRVFIFIKYELYLNAWKTLAELIAEDSSPGVMQLLLATERLMGRAEEG